MNRRPHLRIHHETLSCALVTGYGAREAIKEATGRTPVWATISRAWVLQAYKVPDLIAYAESKG